MTVQEMYARLFARMCNKVDSMIDNNVMVPEDYMDFINDMYINLMDDNGHMVKVNTYG